MACPGCSLQGELGWSEVEMAGRGLQGTLDLAGAWIGWWRGQGNLVASPSPHHHPLTLFHALFWPSQAQKAPHPQLPGLQASGGSPAYTSCFS